MGKAVLSLRSRACIRVLLNHYHHQSRDRLLKFLPDQEKTDIEALPFVSDDISSLLTYKEEFLRALHYSWLIPVIKKVPPSLLPLVSSLLSEEQRVGIAGEEDAFPAPSEGESSVFLKPYIISLLFSYYDKGSTYPQQWVSHTNLSPLLSFSKKHLVQCIDFLGLYDLAKELPCVLDKTIQKQIFSALSPMQRHYLKKCFTTKDKAPFPRLNLQGWNGKKKTLRDMLHYRGLMRFAYALAHESPVVIWYFCHRIDVGRTRVIKQCITKKGKCVEISAYFGTQVVDVVEFFMKRGHGKKKR